MRYSFVGDYAVTQPFGVYDPAYANYPNSCHPGTDWGLPEGTPLVAPFSGVVKVFDRETTLASGRGKEVRVVDGSIERRLCHLSRIDVKAGQKVQEGDVVGLSGNTGYSSGPHLHDEFMVGGVYVNLERYLTTEDEMIIDEELANLLADTLRYDPGSGADEAFKATFIGMDVKQMLREFQKSDEFSQRRALLGGQAEQAVDEIKQVLSERGLL